jgi:hypothetical protein
MFSLRQQRSSLRPRALFQMMPSPAVAEAAAGTPADFIVAACGLAAFTAAPFTPDVSVAAATVSLAELGRRIRSRDVPVGPAIPIVR